MMVNSLTTKVGATFAPIILETLVKHYFERLKKDISKGKSTNHLRRDELLYDQAFNVVKNFLAAASFHTVEECQSFANTRTPSPPWVRVVRVLIPMSSCDEAAVYLIKVLGGEEVVKRTVGGTKWWQVRGVNGIDAQWIVAKKDWRDAKKRSKEQKKQRDNMTPDRTAPATPSSHDFTEEDPDPGTYQQDMDEMRCILYFHGGGYYFGSVDQERYCIQRHARKINGRVFAINYRLAPQYPFPCAIQDALAAYLFLIRPPLGASHRPVKPAHIILAGDSAGGGITLALLQVLRDAGLPLPAGGILVSPWCDLTHSFPSIHTNTATDVIPDYGLSMQKPSTLWPPPSEEMTRHVHATLRSRIHHMVHLHKGQKDVSLDARPKNAVLTNRDKPVLDGMPVDVGSYTAPPALNSPENQKISIVTTSGETLTIDQQVHLYTQNSLVAHPLISPVLSYLGGLPPLLFIAGNGEVLRDEITYTAHKAADPSKYPIKDDVRLIYPSLAGIEKRFGPTPVHLQVYDDAAHVLPVLFSFTTPAKFCYRAIAIFCKQVTGMIPGSQSPRPPPFPFFNSPQLLTPISDGQMNGNNFFMKSEATSSKSRSDTGISESSSGLRSMKSLRRKLSQVAMTVRGNSMTNLSDADTPPVPKRPIKKESDDVAGPRFGGENFPAEGHREAGDAIVYSDTPESPSWYKGMIRERVSTRGVIRPLEPESELDAFHVPPEMIGAFSELAVRRYLNAKAKFDKKFSGVQEAIDKRRQHNLELAKKDIYRNMAQLQGDVTKHAKESNGKRKIVKGLIEGLAAASDSWSWAWALECDERPPPSSIVSRRDTEEARQLARIADQASLEDDSSMSGNHLWSMLVDALTSPPGRDKYLSSTMADGDQTEEVQNVAPNEKKPKTNGFSRFIPERKVIATEAAVEQFFADV